jgi:lysozyme family protein
MATLEALFQQFKAGYENNWQNMQIRPGSAVEAKKEATRLLDNKSIYQKIEATTNVRWWFIGLCTTANPDSISTPTSAMANL